jgi:chorismate dehydratase
MQLIVGRIPFFVCTPYFHDSLESHSGAEIFLDGTPREHNQNLAQGLIHLSPSSSYEYAKHPDLYWILPDICTASTLEIRSVKLFSKKSLLDLNREPIELSDQSETSNNLLKLLTEQWKGIHPVWKSASSEGPQPTARILIGDRALLEDQNSDWPFRYDLATLWQEWKGLPFVFGMWMIHRSVLESPGLREALQSYRAHLHQAVADFRADPRHALERWLKKYPSPIHLDDLLLYYNIIDYRFTPAHQESLREFYQECALAGLIEKAPDLRFVL